MRCYCAYFITEQFRHRCDKIRKKKTNERTKKTRLEYFSRWVITVFRISFGRACLRRHKKYLLYYFYIFQRPKMWTRIRLDNFIVIAVCVCVMSSYVIICHRWAQWRICCNDFNTDFGNLYSGPAYIERGSRQKKIIFLQRYKYFWNYSNYLLTTCVLLTNIWIRIIIIIKNGKLKKKIIIIR